MYWPSPAIIRAEPGMPAGRVNSGRVLEIPDTDAEGIVVGCAQAAPAPVEKAATATNSRAARLGVAMSRSPTRYSARIGARSSYRWFPAASIRFMSLI